MAAPVTSPVIQVGAITDEFSPALDQALDAIAALGMTSLELRVVDGRNIVDLTDAEMDDARRRIAARGMHVLAIASPVLKCILPDAPPVDHRFQQDSFNAPYGLADQPRLIERAFAAAERLGARIVRVFSYWRTTDPAQCFERIVEALGPLADEAERRGLVVGLENEHACNIGTGAETARVLRATDHDALGVVWDPANALVAGETPFPDGYGRLPPARIVHVHAKDCRVNDHTPTWGPIGEMDVGWSAQIAALVRDGYRGAVHLETHWTGPHGDKLEASAICGRALQALVERASG
jgi:sugar phosphate isomerase/epimerase